MLQYPQTIRLCNTVLKEKEERGFYVTGRKNQKTKQKQEKAEKTKQHRAD